MEMNIRRVEVEDYQDLQDVYAQPKVYADTLQLPFPSELLWKNRLLEPPDNLHVLVCEIEHRVVAHLGLQLDKNARRRHVGHIGMAVHDDWHRKGIGSALLAAGLALADNWLNLSRIELSVYVSNAAAISLYEKFGFVKEGTLKRYAFRSGAFEDVFAMARLK